MSRGFTLIEIAVVLAIVTVLSTIAAPNLINMRNNFRNKGAATDIAAMIRTGRSLAMEANSVHALVVRDGVPTDPNDDRAVLLKCPDGTTTAYNFSSITQAMIDGSTAFPAGFSMVRKADIAKDVGMGPGSQGVLTLAAAYSNIPRTTGCSFCTSGVGAIVFQTDGELGLTGSDPNKGSVTVSLAAKWPTPQDGEMYTITVRRITGEVRVWH